MRKQIAESRKTATAEAETASKFVYSVHELAEVVGVSERTIHRLVAQGLPQIGHGRYDVRACFQWLVTRERESHAQDTGRSETIRTELVEAQRDRVRLDIEQLRGTLLPRDMVAQVLARIASLTASQLDSLAPRLAGTLADESDPRRVQDTLLREARAVRMAIAVAMRELASGIETGAAFEAAEDA